MHRDILSDTCRNISDNVSKETILRTYKILASVGTEFKFNLSKWTLLTRFL